MQIIQHYPFGVVQKLGLLMLVVGGLLVSAGDEKNETLMVLGTRKMSAALMLIKRQAMAGEVHEQHQKHAFDAFFSSERRVPNESDPLHNR